MIKRKTLFYVRCLGVLIFLVGCGYTTRSTLPRSVQTIYVETFDNDISYTDSRGRNIYLPLLEVDARNAVIDRYLFDGNLRVADPQEADLILKGRLIKYYRGALRYTDAYDVEEYRVQITVAFELWDSQRDKLIWKEPHFTGEAEYFVSGPQAITEQAAIDLAIKDLARRIVERTIEAW